MFHVVTVFPDLLTFSFYAPFILRLALGVYALAIGFSKKHPPTPEGVVAEEPTLSKLILRGLFILAGISLIAGFYMQIGALVLGILFLIFLLDKNIRIAPALSRLELTLLFVIAISLLLTGAGPYAIDYPF